jgi:hypothetical protein
MYYGDEQRGNMVDNHQTHLAATLLREFIDFIQNIFSDQIIAIPNNLLSKISTLPATNTRPGRQLELLFGISTILFSLYNYINQRADNSQISRNKNFINSLTHIAKIQVNHCRRLDIEVANDCYFNIQQLKFNQALLVSACQDITFQLMLSLINLCHYPTISSKKASAPFSARFDDKQTFSPSTKSVSMKNKCAFRLFLD